ncbi:MAG: hypothetical protein PHQ54_00185 [Candidatus Omnitrophica bacterium]|nr:hypothetical protein [Candidatus Omnitrophota bacterium]
MKNLILSLVLSFLWHAVFLFFLQPEFMQVRIYKNSPDVRFWGDIFQNIRSYSDISTIDENEAAVFIKELFEFKINLTEGNAVLFDVSEPFLKTVAKTPHLKAGYIAEKYRVPEYIVIAPARSSLLRNYAINLDKYSKPVLVVSKNLSGDFVQDCENWIEIKSWAFYSPSELSINNL